MPARNQLPKICIALGLPEVEKLVSSAEAEYDAGERFFEFRLDYLPKPEDGLQAIAGFLKDRHDCTVLATCRRHQNKGRFNGSIEEQIRILDAAADAGAQAVDVEIESAENVTAHLDALRAKCQLVLSYHNYEGTPALDTVVRRMTRIPADAYKVVTTARKPSDNGRVLALAKTHSRRNLVLLAVSSANRTGLPAATDADGAEEMLGEAARVLLDAGPTAGPVPSTIVDCTSDQGRVLRQGVITLETLNEVVEPLGALVTDED